MMMVMMTMMMRNVVKSWGHGKFLIGRSVVMKRSKTYVFPHFFHGFGLLLGLAVKIIGG
jgi:hypothetical protein